MSDFKLDVDISETENSLLGFEVGLIEVITEYMRTEGISIRNLSKITGISSGKLQYHLTGKAGDNLATLLLIVNKLGFGGQISLAIEIPQNPIKLNKNIGNEH